MKKAYFMGIGVLIVAFICTGCQDDDCDAKDIPVRGSASQFTLEPGDHQGVTLAAPASCKDDIYIDGHFIALEGSGTARIGYGLDGGCTPGATDGGAGCSLVDWNTFISDVTQALPNVDGLSHGLGLACKYVQSLGCIHFFALRDWADADTVVLKVMEKIRQFDLGQCVGVVVSGQAVACAH